MSLKIPKSFMLLGKTVTVAVIDSADWKMPDAIGFYDSHASQISLLKTHAELMEHTYLHELMHAVCTAMGRDKLSQDEAFIDMCSGLIHQALTSASYKA